MILAALVRKELIEIRRDRVTLATAVVLPLLLLFIFGYGITLDVKDVRFAVLDRDRSQASARLVDAFTASGYFERVRDLAAQADVDRVLDHGAATLVLVVPPDFSDRLAAGRTADVQLLVDGTFSATALIVLNYARTIVNRHSMALAGAAARAQGLTVPPHVEVAARVWYNAPMRSVNYIVPGLFAVLLMAFPPLLTALAIVREKERGTIEQVFVSPVSPAVFILGKILPYAGIAFVEMLVVLAVGTFWFDIPFRGSLPLLLAASLVYVFVTVGIGVFVSTLLRTQVAAVFLSLVVTMMPSFLFSGFLFPIATMPYVLQLYTYAFPARYFNDISRDLYLKGVGIEYLWWNAALLAAYGAVIVLVATWRFRKKVA
ncbi:MAG: ABC transporter permease [Burkholderiales bacterium]|nr:ABC transporter permease [Burkholderiales bacterium]